MASVGSSVRSPATTGWSWIGAGPVLSSAGCVETMRMSEHAQKPGLSEKPGFYDAASTERPPGRLSFFETISLLDAQPSCIGCDRTTIFFNTAERFHWERPNDLVD